MKRRLVYEHELLDDLRNASMPLWMWKQKLTALIEEFGDETIMFTDSGNNDSQMVLEVKE